MGTLLFMTKFLSKSALLFDQDELNFMVLSKSWPYFREHFDLCPLYRSSQTNMVKLVLVHITEQVLLQLVFFLQSFQHVNLSFYQMVDISSLEQFLRYLLRVKRTF